MMDEETGPSGSAGDERASFLSAQHIDQLMSMLLALAAEVSALQEWRRVVSEALLQVGLPITDAMANARAQPALERQASEERAALVRRLLAASAPEPSHEKPVAHTEAP